MALHSLMRAALRTHGGDAKRAALQFLARLKSRPWRDNPRCVGAAAASLGRWAAELAAAEVRGAKSSVVCFYCASAALTKWLLKWFLCNLGRSQLISVRLLVDPFLLRFRAVSSLAARPA